MPRLVASCQCSVGVNLDGHKFSCPTALPLLTRQAQTILHRFESLQCTTGSKNAKGLDGRQLIPIWAAAAGPGQRPLMSRAEHKQVLTWHLEGMAHKQQHRQQVQQQRQQNHRTVVLGVLGGVLGTVVLTAAAALVVLKGRQQRWQDSSSEVRGRRVLKGPRNSCIVFFTCF